MCKDRPAETSGTIELLLWIYGRRVPGTGEK